MNDKLVIGAIVIIICIMLITSSSKKSEHFNYIPKTQASRNDVPVIDDDVFKDHLLYFRRVAEENLDNLQYIPDAFMYTMGQYKVPIDVLVNLDRFDNIPDTLWNTPVTLLVLILQKLGIQNVRNLLLPQNIPTLFDVLRDTNPKVLTIEERRILLSALNNFEGTPVYSTLPWTSMGDVSNFYERVRDCDMT